MNRLEEAAIYADAKKLPIIIRVRKEGVQISLHVLHHTVSWAQLEHARINLLIDTIDQMIERHTYE